MSAIEIKNVPPHRQTKVLGELRPGELFQFADPGDGTMRLMVRLPNDVNDWPRYRILNWSGYVFAGGPPSKKVVLVQLVEATVEDVL